MNLYKKCLERWGEKSQIHQAMGECGEFIADAQNFNRGKIGLESLLGEAVDVYIMMLQMRELDPELFDELKEKTLKRIQEKVNPL
jgi:hypothetical protein